MKLLLDTQILIWAACSPRRIQVLAREQIDDLDNEPMFSSASIWEVTIKYGLGRKDFQVDPYALRRGLLDSGYTEVTISSAHTLAVGALPPIHKDPFDRILIAQAITEGITLLTADAVVARYPGPIRQI